MAGIFENHNLKNKIYHLKIVINAERLNCFGMEELRLRVGRHTN